jgi:hypothetical protein
VTSQQTKTRRFSKLLFFLLLVVAAVWWSLWFPFDEEKLRRAIPGNSTLIVEIQSPGERWDTIHANPLVTAFLPGASENNARPTAASDTRRIAFLVRWLAPTRALLAYVPEYASSDRPAWVAASWSGHRAQLFRWALGMNLVPGFHAERTNYGHTFWVLRLPDETMPFLSVDVSDGILMACVSHQRDGVRELIRRMEFHAPPAPLFRSFAGAQHKEVTNLIARAVLAPAAHAQSPEAMLSAKLTAFDADRIAGAAAWHQPALLPLGQPDAKLASALDWLGPDVCLTLYIPTTTNRPLNWLGSSLPPVWRTALASLDRTATTNAAVFAALLGGECSGRMLGLRVPTVVIGIQCDPATELGDQVRLGLDILNSTYAWGLIPLHREVAGTPMITVEASRPCLLNGMADRERPALTLHKNWLIFCSNADVLERLLLAGPPPAGGGFRQSHDARLWIDFSRTAQCMRHALAVYELSLLRGEETAGSRTARRQVEQARSWIEALSAFAIGDVSVHSSPHETQLDFELRR